MVVYLDLSEVQIGILKLLEQGELEHVNPRLRYKYSAVRALLRRGLIDTFIHWNTTGSYKIYRINDSGMGALEALEGESNA